MNPQDIDIIVGCEESQAITIEFRKRGFNAFSCDLQTCSGGQNNSKCDKPPKYT